MTKPERMLQFINERIENGIIRISRRGVPHLVINNYYSVVHFGNSKSFRIFAGYATPFNKKICDIKTREEVVHFLNSRIEFETIMSKGLPQ